ncbi:protein-tyrosine-phosphatase [Lactobacillus nasalidis]|uniref:Protein-tyrosine-phosphatase n=1 Tax=Lactobacillus nasalidis TaxID=2797258 RepID=A0ABQ3W5P3_9LACO|nr:tyrosine-protein phosphatase [Lactobacillus nasalidis]GHV98306.1 protein-tyrosine-phosphatase [Lactobacillus nasalidis]GHV98921.1 protein-tyrosine-phosphatase [Lactobacillus nasalidis]GHW01868.1 protein-tyrosine-phosphatase [Lactobacillus nasalidis]
MAEELLPLKTVRNPRDLGGYAAFAGRKIKPGLLLRTGTVAAISAEDADYLRARGVKTIIDLRSPQECCKRPDKQLAGIRNVNIPINNRDQTKAGASLAELARLYSLDPLAGFRHMVEGYRLMVTEKHAQAAFGRVLACLAEAEGGTVYHCSEGKDRTGLVTVFLLTILGVDPETIRQDYLLSAPYLNGYRAKRDQEARENGESLVQRANLRSLGTVSNEYLDSALIAIDQEYGGMEAFISKQLGVTAALQDQLRAKYLEK